MSRFFLSETFSKISCPATLRYCHSMKRSSSSLSFWFSAKTALAFSSRQPFPLSASMYPSGAARPVNLERPREYVVAERIRGLYVQFLHKIPLRSGLLIVVVVGDDLDIERGLPQTRFHTFDDLFQRARVVVYGRIERVTAARDGAGELAARRAAPFRAVQRPGGVRDGGN